MSQDLLKIIGDYADQVAAAERQAEQRSMDAARAMTELYESGAWVDEWLEQKPAPKRPSAKWDPADRNRFISWQAWKLEQAGRRALYRTSSWRLLEAEATRKICAARTDLAIAEPFQPLFWLRKNRYEDRAPEVWARAVELAGGDPRAVTSKHTRKALAEWKHESFSRRLDGTPRSSAGAISKAASAAARANKIRRDMLDDIAELYRLAGTNDKALDEFNGLLADLEEFLTTKRAEAAA